MSPRDVDQIIDDLNDTMALRCCDCPACNHYAPDFEEHQGESCRTWELIREFAAAHDAKVRAEGACDVAERVEAVLDEWMREAGPESEAHRVFGPQVVSVSHIETTFRAALAATEGAEVTDA